MRRNHGANSSRSQQLPVPNKLELLKIYLLLPQEMVPSLKAKDISALSSIQVLCSFFLSVYRQQLWWVRSDLFEKRYGDGSRRDAVALARYPTTEQGRLSALGSRGQTLRIEGSPVHDYKNDDDGATSTKVRNEPRPVQKQAKRGNS